MAPLVAEVWLFMMARVEVETARGRGDCASGHDKCAKWMESLEESGKEADSAAVDGDVGQARREGEIRERGSCRPGMQTCGVDRRLGWKRTAVADAKRTREAGRPPCTRD